MQSLLTVTKKSDSYDLTILETVKNELNIKDNSQDKKLELLIHQTSGAISTICNRIFAEETVSEVFRLHAGRVGRWHSWGREELSVETLVLRRRPISSIISVIEDGMQLLTTEYETNFEAGLLCRLTGSDFRAAWYANKITVSYIAGYVLLETLPYDLERACLLWVKANYIQDRRRDLGIRSEEVPGVINQTFFDRNSSNPNSPPPEVMVLLNPYMEIGVR